MNRKSLFKEGIYSKGEKNRDLTGDKTNKPNKNKENISQKQ